MKTIIFSLVAMLCWHGTLAQTNVSSGFEELDEWAEQCLTDRPYALGYPGNYDGNLDGFYKWYTANNLGNVLINNAGDPFEKSGALSSAKFERDVIEFFAPLYGFDASDLWGIVTMSGTDGNNHGIYFGVNYLKGKTGRCRSSMSLMRHITATTVFATSRILM